MNRKIVLEISIEGSPYHLLPRLQQLITFAFQDLKTDCFKFTAFEDGNEVPQRAIDNGINTDSTFIQNAEFHIGSLSFNISSKDNATNQFLDRCIKNVVDNLDNEKYNIISIAQELNVSKPTLFRKIKQITGLSVTLFVRQIKMQVAYRLLQTGKYTVSEVAWQCGYSSARHFSKIFYLTFRQYPSKIFS